MKGLLTSPGRRYLTAISQNCCDINNQAFSHFIAESTWDHRVIATWFLTRTATSILTSPFNNTYQLPPHVKGGDRQVKTMEDIHTIITSYNRCGSYSQVAREMHVSRNTIKKYIWRYYEVRSGIRDEILLKYQKIGRESVIFHMYY